MRPAAVAAARRCGGVARRMPGRSAAGGARGRAAETGGERPPARPAAGAPTLAYTLSPLAPTVYAQVTAASNCATLVRARGAEFARRIAQRVPPLPPGCEPDAARVAEEVAELLARAEAAERDRRGAEDARASLVFAGHGDPLLRLDCVEAVSRAVRAARPHVRVRANTSGLLPPSCAARVAAAVDEVSVLLHAADEGV